MLIDLCTWELQPPEKKRNIQLYSTGRESQSKTAVLE